MDCHCYLKKGVVYIPTMGKIGKGFYRDIEPVAVVPVSDTAGLRHAFQEAIARGNPDLPSRPAHLWPPAVVLKYAGVKSWSAFERGTQLWSIDEKDGIYRIIGKRKGSSRGWTNDPDNIVALPPGSGIDDICDRMVAILQAAT